jgi:predicted phosphodiesterase
VYQQPTLLASFIQECQDRDIQYLVCAGDVIEGLMHRQGAESERFLHTINEFEQYVQKVYPAGFKHSFLLSGNHEKSFNRAEWGYNFCKELCYRRPDLTYLSQDGMFIGPGNVLFYVCHDGSACNKPHALGLKRLKSKVMQLIADRPRFEVVILGHCHKNVVLKSFMGKVVIGCGTFQNTTPYLQSTYGKADVGGTILSYSVCDGVLCNVQVEWLGEKQLGGVRIHDY